MQMNVVHVEKDGTRLLARSSCRKCLGRGYAGFLRAGNNWRVKEGAVPCECLQSVSVPIIDSSIPWWKRWLIWLKNFIGAGEARKRAVGCSTQPRHNLC